MAWLEVPAALAQQFEWEAPLWLNIAGCLSLREIGQLRAASQVVLLSSKVFVEWQLRRARVDLRALMVMHLGVAEGTAVSQELYELTVQAELRRVRRQ